MLEVGVYACTSAWICMRLVTHGGSSGVQCQCGVCADTEGQKHLAHTQSEPNRASAGEKMCIAHAETQVKVVRVDVGS